MSSFNLEKKTLFLNFKTYVEALGSKGLEIARIAEKASLEEGIQIALVIQAVDLRSIAGSVSIPVFAQTLDSEAAGKSTGKLTPESVKDAGAQGCILNHAESKVDNERLEKGIQRAKEHGLIVMACAESTQRARQIASFQAKPDLIAIEPPELIGSETLSVSTANPEIITSTVQAVKAIACIPLITGAGIKSEEDVRLTVKLGSRGVVVAPQVMRAHDKEKAIRELAGGLQPND